MYVLYLSPHRMHWRTVLMNSSKPGPKHWLKISTQTSWQVGQQPQPRALWKSWVGGSWRTIRIYNKSKHVSSAECRRIWTVLRSPQIYPGQFQSAVEIGIVLRDAVRWHWHESITSWLQCYKQLHAVSWHESIKQPTRQTSDLLVVQPAYTEEKLTLNNIWMAFMLTGLTYIHLKYIIQ